ncbi:hypothetical protein ABZ924_28535 [Streptomyces sp. NPDC046876]|uniref:hypothetical protein n=1 Tax=Streptomyces sp. NPDC046876 TaxID=3155616 RepID=UPI00340964E0
MNSLQIFLSEDGAEAERLDWLAGVLRQDLLQLDVDEVTTVRRGDDPAGARGVAVEAGALLVDLGSSVAVLREVLHAVMDWWRRSRSRPTIRLEMDGDVLEISEASTGQVDRSFELFVNRHSTHGAAP